MKKDKSIEIVSIETLFIKNFQNNCPKYAQSQMKTQTKK